MKTRSQPDPFSGNRRLTISVMNAPATSMLIMPPRLMHSRTVAAPITTISAAAHTIRASGEPRYSASAVGAVRPLGKASYNFTNRSARAAPIERLTYCA